MHCHTLHGQIKNRWMVLDTGDTKSMSNFRKHMKICWGQEAVAAADNTSDVRAACEALIKMELVNRSITAALKFAAKGKITYSHHQHTTTEAWYVSLFLHSIIPCYLKYVHLVLKSFIGLLRTSIPFRS